MEAQWRDRNEYICKLIPWGGSARMLPFGCTVSGWGERIYSTGLPSFLIFLTDSGSGHPATRGAICAGETQVGVLGNLPAAVALISDDTSGIAVGRSAAFTKSSPTKSFSYVNNILALGQVFLEESI